MNYESLIEWMAHVGGGSWPAFQRAVAYYEAAETSGNGAGERTNPRPWRPLSDLGYAEFFVNGSTSWRAFAPVIGGVSESQALLCGVRNRRLIDAIEEAAERLGCVTTIEPLRDAPARVSIEGEDGALRAVADAVGLSFVPSVARRVVASLTPVPTMVDTAERSEAPINWTHTAFDFRDLRWSDQAASPTAHAYRSKYGAQRYFVDLPGRELAALNRRSAVYAAAMLNRVDLVEYDEATSTLSTPVATPLPFDYARAVTLCSGWPAEVVDGRLRYSSVPLDTAADVMVLSGGRYPASPRWFRQRVRRSR